MQTTEGINPPKHQLKRHPERRVDEAAEGILAQGLVAHVGFVDAGWPYVIPMSYQYTDQSIYLHGSQQSRALKLLAAGAPACLEITLLDGLVYSRTAMFHSMNYQSVIAFGQGTEVLDPAEKNQVFDAMISRYFDGRSAGADYAQAPPKHLKETLMVRIQIERFSAKQRQGGANGPTDKDPEALGSSGVITISSQAGGCPFAHKEPSTDV